MNNNTIQPPKAQVKKHVPQITINERLTINIQIPLIYTQNKSIRQLLHIYRKKRLN